MLVLKNLTNVATNIEFVLVTRLWIDNLELGPEDDIRNAVITVRMLDVADNRYNSVLRRECLHLVGKMSPDKNLGVVFLTDVERYYHSAVL